MIKYYEFVDIVCDKCGKAYSDSFEYENVNEIESDADWDGWVNDGDYHYCPDCVDEMDYENDDENNEQTKINTA